MAPCQLPMAAESRLSAYQYGADRLSRQRLRESAENSPLPHLRVIATPIDQVDQDLLGPMIEKSEMLSGGSLPLMRMRMATLRRCSRSPPTRSFGGSPHRRRWP